MKAYVIDAYKKNAPLVLRDVPQPKVGPNDLLVNVRAVGLNLIDAKVRDGEYKIMLPYKPPLIAGHDMAGTVVAVGTAVKTFKVGDNVYARPRDGRIGTFAQFIAIDAADVALKPRNLSFEEAASLPLVALTAWQALIERSKVKQGQKVFIQAGSGGVGTIAIQLARHLGAAVATTTSSANVALVRELGAQVVVDYKAEDFANVLSGYDVVLNSQDNATLVKSLRVLRPGGIAISISGPPDAAFARHKGLNPVVRLVFTLLSGRIRSQARKTGVRYEFLFMAGNGAQLAKITDLVEAGVIRPVIDRVFSFDDLNKGLAHVESGRAKGKVVVLVP